MFSFPSQIKTPSLTIPISLAIQKPTHEHIPSQTPFPHTLPQRLSPAHRSVCRLHAGVSAAFCTPVLPLRCSVEPFSHLSNNPRQVVFFCLFFHWFLVLVSYWFPQFMGCSLNFLGFVIIIRLMYVYFISLKCWVVRIFTVLAVKEQFAFF